MDEIVVRVSRALACLKRLQMLSRLAQSKELAPTDLKRELGIALNTVCSHLRRLSDAGLIQRRRSGTWCYCVGRSPYSEDALSGKISRWIEGLLADPEKTIRDYGVLELRNSSSRTAEEALHRLIFEAATAFTNVRRLHILRRLETGKEATVDDVMKELRMSDAAVSRHMDKLVRRRYVEVSRGESGLVYRLSKQYRTPLHQQLYRIVSSTWAKK